MTLDGFSKSPQASLPFSLPYGDIPAGTSIPRDSRILPLNLFTKPSEKVGFEGFVTIL